MVELRPITDENYRPVLKLDVHPEQRTFVAPNVESLAEAYVYPDAEASALWPRTPSPVPFTARRASWRTANSITTNW